MRSVFQLDKAGIQRILRLPEVIPAIEQGFVAYSEGRAVVPPVGEMLFADPPGDVHIKYGYLVGDRYYVVKIASGFYENARFHLSSNNGLVLLFHQHTGEPLCILHDEGYLTDVRTGLAGALAARYFAPRVVRRIGIVGTGTQARMQLRCLAGVVQCREVVVLGRDRRKLLLYQEEMEQEGFAVRPTFSSAELAEECNLIVTTTSSTTPLLAAEQIRPGTHLTAVGADTPQKQELDPEILRHADLVVADSIVQCRERGEIAHALKQHCVTESQLWELGQVIAGRAPRRTSESQVTIVDLTGVAVQDMQIARVVYEAACQEQDAVCETA
jgi:ornithine cyclodeaminase